jgi:Fe-S-cluster-containing dehydrogenase component/CRP-like cAMP-binding protein
MTTELHPEGEGLEHEPFDGELSETDIDRVLALPLFAAIDPEQFPAHMSLRQLIRDHARIDVYEKGQIVVRKGDYGHSAFIVLKGTVAVATDAPPALAAVQVRRRTRSWFSALSQLWRNARVPEARDTALYARRLPWSLRYRAGRGQTPFLRDPDAFFREHKTINIGSGDMFGEIAALSRTPRNATVIAAATSGLLELRWTGMREIRKRDEGFRSFIDERYRSRSLKTHLRESPLFRDLDDAALSRIAAETQFETYGTFDWNRAYKRQLAAQDVGLQPEAEPTIAEQGHYADGLIMIRSGFARVSERLGEGQRTLSVATTNDLFGFEEITAHYNGQGPPALRRSLHAIGYVDILRVPTALVEEYVLRSSEAMPILNAVLSKMSEQPIDQGLMDFLVDRRFINGTQAMVINTERCVNCNDCVTACATAHDNNPRFIRHGPEHHQLMVANACMHCRDPVCLIGCPTGAIQRLSDDGRVVIDDPTCIGCGTCVNSCPYSNIRLVEIRDREGVPIVDEASGKPVLKATKCDLCLDQLDGPACQRACPHDALVRIDIGDQASLARWIER